MAEEQPVILIVDDEEIVRRVLSEKVEAAGYRWEQASSADEALSTIKNTPVQLAVLDIKMPGKSGVELLSEIRRHYPDIAVVMATAVIDINIAIECLRQGAFDYITKPFNLDEVMIFSRLAQTSLPGFSLLRRNYTTPSVSRQFSLFPPVVFPDRGISAGLKAGRGHADVRPLRQLNCVESDIGPTPACHIAEGAPVRSQTLDPPPQSKV